MNGEKTLVSSIMLLPLFAMASASAEAANPNILFILIDDMGWRNVGCYGNEIHETPHIDKLASRGRRLN